MKYLILPLAALGALAACSEQQQQSVENRFQQTESAIENAAATLEAETDNATRAATSALEREADEFENRIDAIDVAPGSGNRSAPRPGNAQRLSAQSHGRTTGAGADGRDKTPGLVEGVERPHQRAIAQPARLSSRSLEIPAVKHLS